MSIENTELAIVPSQENALAVFTTNNGLDPFLSKIREEIDSFFVDADMDMSNAGNRKKIASMAHKIARSKTALDDAGKELTSQLKEMPRKVDAERKRMRDLLDEWKEQVRNPLTQWELAEEDRITKILTRIEAIEHLQFVGFVDVDSIKTQIENVKITIIDDSFAEFKDKAEAAKNKILVYLQDLLENRIEEERAESERLRAEEERRIEAEKKVEIERAEREKRIAEDAARKAEQEAAERAKKEKEAAERRELELKLEAEKAKREALEAEERAKKAAIETEQRLKREAEELARKEREEQQRRESDKVHREKIHKTIVEDLMAHGLTLDEAQNVCNALKDGFISYVEIKY